MAGSACGRSGIRCVLFVCIENSCRSQMAEALARMIGGDRIEAFSAGSRPSGRVNPRAIEVMAEAGCDLSAHRSKSLAGIPPRRYDAVISMGCGDACPAVPARIREDWDIPDPATTDIGEVRAVRDLLRAKVESLLARLLDGQEAGGGETSTAWPPMMHGRMVRSGDAGREKMRTILDLFGQSPFRALQRHMDTVLEPVDQVRPFFEAFLAGDAEKARTIRKRILKLEHEADLVKNEIRDHLPKSYFLPVDRRDLLALLHQQDRLADLCEDIVIVATLKADLTLPRDLHPAILEEVDLSLEACVLAREVIERLDELLETSFGGEEAARVIELIDRVSAKEHEVDKHAYTTARQLFVREQELGAVDLGLWQKLLQLVGRLANAAESIGDHVRLMLSR